MRTHWYYFLLVINLISRNLYQFPQQVQYSCSFFLLWVKGSGGLSLGREEVRPSVSTIIFSIRLLNISFTFSEVLAEVSTNGISYFDALLSFEYLIFNPNLYQLLFLSPYLVCCQSACMQLFDSRFCSFHRTTYWHSGSSLDQWYHKLL